MAEKATIVNVWYKYFPRERASVTAILAEIRSREITCAGIAAFLRNVSGAKAQIANLLASIQRCEKQLTPAMKEMKLLFVKERNAWANALDAIISQNKMIPSLEAEIKEYQTEMFQQMSKKHTDDVIDIYKVEIASRQEQLHQIVNALNDAIKGFQKLIRKILVAEKMFLPVENGRIMTNPPDLWIFFRKLPVMTAEKAFAAAKAA